MMGVGYDEINPVTKVKATNSNPYQNPSPRSVNLNLIQPVFLNPSPIPIPLCNLITHHSKYIAQGLVFGVC